MIDYTLKPTEEIVVENKTINCFPISDAGNIDTKTVESFGEEWSKFSNFSQEEISKIGSEYFDIVSEKQLNKESYVLDLGCGTGRWTKYMVNKAKFVEAVDPSNAVVSAARLLKNDKNVRITKASVDNIPFEDNTFDFAISLGVLHHIPDTQQALKKVVEKIKPGGYILLYLYYSLDNRGLVYKLIFKLSSLIRYAVSSLPKGVKQLVCDIIAIFIYLPFVLVSSLTKKLFPNTNLWKKIPLSYYVGKTFNVIKNDALDRFGTPLEQRFSKAQIEKMMRNVGLDEIIFSENEPYWHVLEKKI